MGVQTIYYVRHDVWLVHVLFVYTPVALPAKRLAMSVDLHRICVD